MKFASRQHDRPVRGCDFWPPGDPGMILCCECAPLRGQPGIHLFRPCFVDQNVTAIASLDRLLGTCIACDYDAAVRSIESVSVTLHRVLRGESSDCDF